MLWVLAALAGSVGQVGRNAMQASLTASIGTIGATQVRFLFGLPFALVFLALIAVVTGEAVPLPGAASLGFTTAGALAQIGGTALMLVTMKSQSFAVTTAWLKTEPVIVALVAAAVLGDPLTPLMMLAIAVATCGVLLMTVKPGRAGDMLADWRPALTGLAAAALFGASATGFRGGITHLAAGGFLIRASATLAVTLAIQTAVLILWMAFFDRAALRGSFGVWRSSLAAGALGASASLFWFIGFSLTSAANVRTVALVEVIFAQALSRWHFRQPVSRRQMAGMVAIILGVGLLLLQQ